MSNKNISAVFFNQKITSVTTPLPGSIPYATRYRLPVKKRYEGYNIVDFYLEIVKRSNPKIWLDKIEKETLLINKKPAQKNSILSGGDITEHCSEPKAEPWVNNQISLLYSDDDILVINKPAPLPMHPSGRFNKNSLTEILKLALPNEDLKIIHRLDANTTGVVVLGRNKKIASSIGEQFKTKKAQKTYLAMVEGLPLKDYFDTNIKIGLDKTVGGGRSFSENGIDAYTEFEVMERFLEQNKTLIKVTPHTGRTNQIRLHLATLGHPIIGDKGYKNTDYFKTNPLTYATDSLYLHAWKLSFDHLDKNFKIEAPIPLKFKY